MSIEDLMILLTKFRESNIYFPVHRAVKSVSGKERLLLLPEHSNERSHEKDDTVLPSFFCDDDDEAELSDGTHTIIAEEEIENDAMTDDC